MTFRTLGLTPDHLHELREESGIEQDVIEARGYRSILRERETSRLSDEATYLRKLGFSRGITDMDDASLWPALFVPSYNPKGTFVGTAQLKPWTPRKNGKGKPRKYECPVGKAAGLDVHPFHRDSIIDPTVPLWVTEGVKKADSLTSQLRDENGKGTGAVVALSGVFNFRSRLLALGEWEDIALRGREITICFDADAEQNHQVAEAMRRLGAFFRGRGAERIWYVTPPSEHNGKSTKGADDFFVAGGTLQELEARRRPRPLQVKADDSFTDRTLAQRVAAEDLSERLRYVPGMGWLMWNEALWEGVPEERVRGMLGAWLDTKLREAAEAAKYGRGDEVKEWHGVRSAGRARAICYWLQEILLADAAEFDTDPDLLNCSNGVVNLETGELMEPSPDRYMTKNTGVAYVPDFTTDDWSKALEALPVETLEWFQIRLGQSATGHMDPTARLVILQSGGSSGKSTVLTGIKLALGDYAIQLDDNVLIQRDNAKSNAATPEMMALRGARFAYMEETPESAQLNDARLKKIIGTTEITGRNLYETTVTFRNTTTSMLSTNFPPKVARSDHGTWRRLALLQFPYKYVPREKLTGHPMERLMDMGLIARMELDPRVREAVLAWMVEGARRWYAEGGPKGNGEDGVLNRLPEVVLTATEVWRMETDHISRFIRDHVVFEERKWVPIKEVRDFFNQLLELDGHRPLGQVEFGRRFLGSAVSMGPNVCTDLKRPHGLPDGLDGYGGMVGPPAGNPMIRVYCGLSIMSDKPDN